MSSRSVPMILALAAVFAFAAPPAQAADDAYTDAAEVRGALVDVLGCASDRAGYMRLGNALTDVYYGSDVQPALAGWRKLEGDNAFVVELQAPAPIELYGHSTDRIMMAGTGLLAVLDGDLVDTLAKQLHLAPSNVPMAGHILTREVRTTDLGDGMVAHVVQTVSTISSHPGKTLVGCEYRTDY